MALASLTDYESRFGTPADPEKIAQLLDDASSLVQEVAHQKLEKQTGDVATLDGDGTEVLFLPELPVTAVSTVVSDGTTVGASGYAWSDYGALLRVNGLWPNKFRSVVVTYDHGYDAVPLWIVSLVCTMVERANVQGVQGAVRAESFVDSYTVTYAGNSAGTGLVGLSIDEVKKVKALGVARSIV